MVLTLLAAIPLSAGGAMLASSTTALSSVPTASAVTTSVAEPVEYLQVAPGDSLWSIAETVAPEADPREIIDELVRYNGLDGFDLYPGQKLAVPARY